MILYPFQREAKEVVLRQWESGHKGALVSLPTGAGKTIVFSGILQSSLSESNNKGLKFILPAELDRKTQLRGNVSFVGVYCVNRHLI